MPRGKPPDATKSEGLRRGQKPPQDLEAMRRPKPEEAQLVLEETRRRQTLFKPLKDSRKRDAPGDSSSPKSPHYKRLRTGEGNTGERSLPKSPPYKGRLIRPGPRPLAVDFFDSPPRTPRDGGRTPGDGRRTPRDRGQKPQQDLERETVFRGFGYPPERDNTGERSSAMSPSYKKLRTGRRVGDFFEASPKSPRGGGQTPGDGEQTPRTPGDGERTPRLERYEDRQNRQELDDLKENITKIFQEEPRHRERIKRIQTFLSLAGEGNWEGNIDLIRERFNLDELAEDIKEVIEYKRAALAWKKANGKMRSLEADNSLNDKTTLKYIKSIRTLIATQTVGQAQSDLRTVSAEIQKRYPKTQVQEQLFLASPRRELKRPLSSTEQAGITAASGSRTPRLERYEDRQNRQELVDLENQINKIFQEEPRHRERIDRIQAFLALAGKGNCERNIDSIRDQFDLDKLAEDIEEVTKYRKVAKECEQASARYRKLEGNNPLRTRYETFLTQFHLNLYSIFKYMEPIKRLTSIEEIKQAKTSLREIRQHTQKRDAETQD